MRITRNLDWYWMTAKPAEHQVAETCDNRLAEKKSNLGRAHGNMAAIRRGTRKQGRMRACTLEWSRHQRNARDDRNDPRPSACDEISYQRCQRNPA